MRQVREAAEVRLPQMWLAGEDDETCMKAILRKNHRNPGDGKLSAPEEQIEEVKFNIFKFNPSPRPNDPRRVMIICCFSEFGCETVGAMYCIPRIIREHPGKYVIVVGWYGREYLYRHLADEFWEVKSEHMWLREKARAFHHESSNLSKIEKSLESFGIVVPSEYLGRLAISARCESCGYFWNTVYLDGKYDRNDCLRCSGERVLWPMLGDVGYWKPRATRLPPPSSEKVLFAKEILGDNPVGVFARGRKCYGRNLQPEFYARLLSMLEGMGYDPIWLGEKESTLPCPSDRVVDFSRMPESRDLELTLAIVSGCRFTVQFWTASSRLAGMMGVPYLLFESPDQIWGKGQEGLRRNLCDFGPRKLSINHYLSVYGDNDGGLKVVEECIDEMNSGNYDDHIGLVEDKNVVLKMREDNKKRVGDL